MLAEEINRATRSRSSVETRWHSKVSPASTVSREIEADSRHFYAARRMQPHHIDRARVFGRAGIVGRDPRAPHLCVSVPVAQRDVIGTGCCKLIVANEPGGTQPG